MKVKSIFVLALASLATATLAHAATVSYTEAVTGGTTTFPTADNPVGPVQLPGFNTALGKLTGVTITFAISGDSNAQVYGGVIKSTMPQGSLTDTITYGLTDASLGIALTGGPISENPLSSGSFFVPATPGPYSIADSTFSDSLTNSWSGAGFDASLFESGNLSFDFWGNSAQAYTGPTNVYPGFVDTINVTPTVEYTYTTVPEGGAAAIYLTIAGAFCFGAMFLFRRNKLGNDVAF